MRDENLLAYGKGIIRAFGGDVDHEDSIAAAVNVAEVFSLIHDALTK